MTEEEKKAIRREKHPGCASQGHKLAALMQKRKEEILPNKEQSTEQSTVQTAIQLNDTYIYWLWYTCCPCHKSLPIFCI